MKTFEEYLKEEEYVYPAEMLTEKNFVSKHRRTPTEMADVHKNVLKLNKHTIVNHETDGSGAHTITHITPKKKVRVTTIKPTTTGRNRTRIHDRPGNSEEQARHVPK